MDSVLHKLVAPGEVHPPHSWVHANAAAREAQAITTQDLGKISWQRDDDTFWVLTHDVPEPKWRKLGEGNVDLRGVFTTLYVRPNGSDSNDGLTEATAFATLNKALHTIPLDFYNGAFDIDITGCEISERVIVPQYRSRGRAQVKRDPGSEDFRENIYKANTQGSVNIRAKMRNILTGLVPVGVTYDPLYHRYAVQFTGASPAPNSLRGLFYDSPGAEKHVPIIDNTSDTLYLHASVTWAGSEPFDVVEPSASIFDPGVDDYWEGRFLLSNVPAGMTIFGVHFRDYKVARITNCPELLVEACSSPGGGVLQVGGVFSRFDRCALSMHIATGSYLFYGCVSPRGGGGVLDYDSMSENRSDSYSMATRLWFDRCWFEDIGFIDTADHQRGARFQFNETVVIGGQGFFADANISSFASRFFGGQHLWVGTTWQDQGSVFASSIYIDAGARLFLGGTFLVETPYLLTANYWYQPTIDLQGTVFCTVDPMTTATLQGYAYPNPY